MDSSWQYAARIIDGLPDLRERGLSNVGSHAFQPLHHIVARLDLSFLVSNTHDQLNVIIGFIEVVKKLQCKKEMPNWEAIAIELLDDDVDIHIVYEGSPTTTTKISCMNEGCNKIEENNIKRGAWKNGEFGVSKNWREIVVKALIALRGEMEPDFVKNAKKQGNYLKK